ncbi:MAG: YHYH domain-containing protein [Clostridia bacterium]|nr:YHYH domain-containing protein [Clostridia bacterium]
MHKFLYILCFLFVLNITVSAHPGGKDKYGGHTEKATGRYHIHNPDGTITYTEKPTEATPTVPEDKKSDNTDESKAPETININGEEKPLQQGVTAVEVSAPDKPNVYTHENKERNLNLLDNICLYFFLFFALIGICAIAFVLLLVLKKLEKKNPILDYIVLIPMLVVFLPAMLGSLLYKLYQKYDETEKIKRNTTEDDFI